MKGKARRGSWEACLKGVNYSKAQRIGKTCPFVNGQCIKEECMFFFINTLNNDMEECRIYNQVVIFRGY